MKAGSIGHNKVLAACLPVVIRTVPIASPRAKDSVAISSVTRLLSSGGGAVYSASKFALEGWMEGFAQELAPLGVRSLLVKPGMLCTDFMDAKSANLGSIDIPDYAEAIVWAPRGGSQPSSIPLIAKVL